MDQLRKYILEQVAAQNLSLNDAKSYLLELQNAEQKPDTDIAVIGMACRFANNDNPDEYWGNLVNGNSSLVTYPEDRRKYFSPMTENPYYAEFLGTGVIDEKDQLEAQNQFKAGYLDNIDKFDAAFFNIPPREAKFMDPAQRLVLETAWSSIEDAGYGGEKIVGTKTGVFIGRDCTSGTFYRFITDSDPMHLTGTWEGILASRLSYIFDLKGPALVVDTACSSGLVAIHEACQAIRNNECEMAIAGGISLGTSAQAKSEDGDDALSTVASNDNLVRTFDKKSTGTVFGEGVATLFLKPLSKALEDGDQVYAVIKGSAINNDGASNGITSPNPLAQEEVILKAWEQAGVHPETINYCEAHGTGTLLGDPIEIKGLTNAFRRFTDKKQFCGIGSAKTNMGHLVGASGVAGIIKVILGLYNKKLPASLNFEEPNPHINFNDSPLYVVDRLMDWERGEAPRRAGISGFGFSGTNAHVVLEEAPEVARQTQAATTGPKLWTLSGKSYAALNEMLKRYQKYLAQKETINLDQVCYTANTGRGHFDYRLAMIVQDEADFRNKIAALQYVNLDEVQLEGVFYGYHKVVSDKKKVKEISEISESEKRALTTKARDLVAKLASGADASTLAELCEIYRQGGNVEWEKAYAGQNIRRVALPVYAFDRTVYWGEIKKSKLKGSVLKQPALHPMIDELLVKSLHQDIYTVKWSIDKQWVLTDHILFGLSIVPGVSYLEIAREIGSRYYPEQRIELKDTIFLTPIIVREDDEVETHYIVQKELDHLRFTVASKMPQEDESDEIQWTVHVETKIYPHNDETTTVHPVQTLRHRPDMWEIEVDEEAITKKGGRVQFGPRWLNVDYVARGEGDVFAELNIPKQFATDLQEFQLHPGMLDNAVNAATQSFGNGMYLPLSYKSFKVFGPMPEHFYTHIRKIDKQSKNQETLSFDISLIDENGKAFVEVEEYTIKKVQQHSLKEANRFSSFYHTLWVAKPQKDAAQAAKAGRILVLKDQNGIAEQVIAGVKREDNEIIVAELGSTNEKRGDNHYVVDGTEAGYVELFRALGENGVTQILHLLSLQGTTDLATKADLDAGVNRSLDSLYYIARATSQSKWKNDIDFVILTDYAGQVDGTETIVHAHNGALLGLAKVVVQEFENLHVRSIDTDAATTVDVLLTEVLSTTPGFRVAFRNGERFVEQFGKVKWSEIERNRTEIQENGVYVITGGTGGLGLAVGQYLAARNQVNLVMLNRSQLPARDQWEAIISSNEQPKLAQRLQTILDIEATGSTVIAKSVDIANEAAMQAMVAELKATYGQINGIIHAAGVAGDGFMVLKDKNVFDEVVQPKVQGTWVLDRVTRDEELDFFINFSSISTLFGARGQGDYTAANTYLDSFAHYRNILGKRTITINWPAWSEVGMAVDFHVSEDVVLFKSLTNDMAFSMLEELLDSNLTNVIPGELNVGLMSKLEPEVPILLSDNIKSDLTKYRNKQQNGGEGAKAQQFTGEVTLSGKGEEEYSDTERKIAQIYAIGLNLPTIDIYESFSSMGGDSIIATGMLKFIDREFPGIVDISDMFSYPTVAEMAEYIDGKRGVTAAVSEQIEAGTEQAAVSAEAQELSDLLDNLESGDVEIDDLLDIISGDDK